MKRPGWCWVALMGLPWLIGACGSTEVVVGEAPGVARVVAGVLGTAHVITVPDTASDGPAMEQPLGSPGGLVADADGAFFFTDRARRRVAEVTAEGDLSWVVGRGTCGFPGPQGTTPLDLCFADPVALARDSTDALLVADPNAHRVYQVDLVAGRVEVFLGTGAAGAAAAGATAATSPTNRPVALAVGPDGAVYVAELSNNRVVRVRTDGILEVVAGQAGEAGDQGDGGPAADAHFVAPAGLAWMGDTLYIADSEANRVRRIVHDTIQSYAGLGAAGFSGDRGPAASALFRDPRGLVAIGSLLFVADRGNYRVRIIRVGPDSINTFVGTGQAEVGADQLDAGRTAIDGVGGLAAAGRAVFVSDSGGYVVRRVVR